MNRLNRSINQSTMVIALNALSLLLVAAMIFTFLNVINIRARVDDSNVDRFDLTYNANRFMNGSASLTNEVRAYAVTADEAHYNGYMNEVEVLQSRTQSIENMKKIGITPEEEAKIDEMLALSNNLIPLETQAMEMTKQGLREEAIEQVYGASYKEVIGKISAIQQEFLAMLDTRAAEQVNALIAQAELAQTLVLIFIIAVAVLQIINVLVVMLSTILPVKALQREMEEIAAGNLSSALRLSPNTSEIGRLTSAVMRTKDELKMYIDDITDKLTHIANSDLDLEVEIDYIGDFKPIKTALVTILGSLNSTVSQISTASRHVASGSDQIADGAQALAQGATEQAASIQELSNTVAEISHRTKANAEKAERAAKLADTIKGGAEKGSRQMGEMMVAVKDISQSSHDISKVIKVIDDIAFQTNILALNAAVEAARAGQHGKGFAVVAEEVRNLASKSAEAAKDTESLIAASMEKAELGERIAEATSSSLNEIVSGINESSSLISGIAVSSDEASRAIAQIDNSIAQVAQVVQQNSATAQESAAASQEMSSQSAVLSDLIAQFRLNENAPLLLE